ncbi:MAG TPA: glycosyltransferase, partial [Dehalococcoidia bacterium]|nr:glycosyltransferase [Dehalococcoidia bacterium]
MFLSQGITSQRFAVDVMGFDKNNAPIIDNWTASLDLLSIGHDRIPKDCSEPVKMLFVGWLEREKGVIELIEVCRNLARTRDFRLNIVGDGTAALLAHTLVDEYQLNDKIHFNGWL